MHQSEGKCVPSPVILVIKVTQRQQMKDVQPEKMHLPHAPTRMEVCAYYQSQKLIGQCVASKQKMSN